jgi:hypothetical protein
LLGTKGYVVVVVVVVVDKKMLGKPSNIIYGRK